MNLQPDSALIKLPVCTIVSELRGELAVEKNLKWFFEPRFEPGSIDRAKHLYAQLEKRVLIGLPRRSN